MTSGRTCFGVEPQRCQSLFTDSYRRNSHRFIYEGIHANTIYLKCLNEEGNPIEDLGNTQVFSSIPSLNGLLNEEMMVKLKSGSLSKEELVEGIMGSTPLKQISKGVDVRWEDPVVPRYNGQRSQRVQCSPAPGLETEQARFGCCFADRKYSFARRLYIVLARRKNSQYGFYEIFIQEFSIGYYPDDCYPDYVV